MPKATATLAAILLLPACAGEIPRAPACDDPATLDQVLTGVFAAVTASGAASVGSRVQVDRERGTLALGADTVRYTVVGDTLRVQAATDSVPRPALFLRDVRTTEVVEESGAFRCAATMEAPYWGGGTRPLRWLSIVSPDDEHVVTGAVLGEPGEIPF